MKFNSIGNPNLPTIIEVGIEQGGIFTIGRYDRSVGKQQSSFEFESRTKGLSRRHALVERSGGDHYYVVDLASTSGTFINDKKIFPNTPMMLNIGDKISFGNAGADYIWQDDFE